MHVWRKRRPVQAARHQPKSWRRTGRRLCLLAALLGLWGILMVPVRPYASLRWTFTPSPQALAWVEEHRDSSLPLWRLFFAQHPRMSDWPKALRLQGDWDQTQQRGGWSCALPEKMHAFWASEQDMIDIQGQTWSVAGWVARETWPLWQDAYHDPQAMLELYQRLEDWLAKSPLSLHALRRDFRYDILLDFGALQIYLPESKLRDGRFFKDWETVQAYEKTRSLWQAEHIDLRYPSSQVAVAWSSAR